jgi:hypothetical protein
MDRKIRVVGTDVSKTFLCATPSFVAPVEGMMSLGAEPD